MGIEKIDKNFAIDKGSADGKKTYVIPHPAFSLHGVFYDEENGRFARMPYAVAKGVNEGVEALSKQTAGGRLCFSTNAKSMQITVTYPELCIMSHMPLTGSSSFALCEVTGTDERLVGSFMPIASNRQGFSTTLALKGETMRNYVLYFPLYNDVASLSVALGEDACVQPFNPYRNVKPIVYYGSSITQGGCANRTDHAYQALICKKNRVDFINLGFSGSARGEESMADYLASIDCSVFVCDYDHNAPSVEHLRATHFPLYERYRKQRPDTPILFITEPDWRNGDIAVNEERHRTIKATYLKAKKLGDKNVYFLSGKTFYGKEYPDVYAVDRCHPTDYGFQRMAAKIYKKLIEIDETLK